MELFESIEGRHSVRAYLTKPVAREDLERIVNAGRLAASARNEQPWEFVVVTDMYTRQQIAELATYGKYIADAGACIAVFCRESTPYCVEDGSAATMNMLLAATGLGLGCCWVAGDKAPYAPNIAELIGAPESHRLVSLVAIGYPSAEPPRAPKRPLHEVIHWENW